MADGTKFNIDGKKLIDYLERAVGDAEGIAQDVTEIYAFEIALQAQQYCTIPSIAQSIGVTPGSEPGYYTVGTNKRHAVYFEFGTRFANPGPPESVPEQLRDIARAYKADPLKRPNYIPARPFLWPAYLSVLPKWLDELTYQFNQL